MSDLQRTFAKSKLARLPAEAPGYPSALHEEDETTVDEDGEIDHLSQSLEATPIGHQLAAEDNSLSADSASSASSTGTVKPEPQLGRFAKPRV